MTRRLVIGGVLAATASAAMAVACGDPQSKIPTSPAAPSVSAVEISGPATIAPGHSARLTATIRLSDASGKTASPAANVRWRSSNSLQLRVDTSGVATASSQLGDATVTADVTLSGFPQRATREITVVPDGTYRLVGRITEHDSQTPVLAARVEVTPGPIVVNTDAAGQFRLYGVPADASVRVTADGYQPLVQPVHLTANATQNLELVLTGPPLNLAGPYTLAIDVTDGCASGSPPLPVILQHRTYDAVITSTGSTTVDVTLTEPRFRINSIGRGNRFSGRVTPASAAFTLDSFGGFYYYYYYGPPTYPNLAERLSDGTYLVVDGTVVVTGTSASVSGALDGRIANWDSSFPLGQVRLGGCPSTSHRFTLTRR